MVNTGAEAALLPTQSTPGVSAATNRLTGSGYDESGNQTQEGGRTFGYDAENRQVSSATPFGFLGHGGFVDEAVSDLNDMNRTPYAHAMPVGAGMPFAPVGAGGGLVAGEAGAFSILSRNGLTPHHMPQVAMGFTSP